MRTAVVALIIGATIAAGCSGDDDGAGVAPPPSPAGTEAPVVTTVETAPPTTTATTIEQTTTTVEPPTTIEQTTTTVDERIPTGFGLVWESQVDAERVNVTEGRPVTDADGITSMVDMVLVFAAGDDEMCRDSAAQHHATFGGEMAEQCLVVQWRFDVAEDFRTDQFSPDGGLSMRSIVTADGMQVDSPFGASGLPGTVGNLATDMFPHGGPGATVYWSTGSNLVAWTQHSYRVPDDLPPIYFE